MSTFEVFSVPTEAPEIGNVRDDRPALLAFRDIRRQPAVRCDAGFLGPLWLSAASLTGRAHLSATNEDAAANGGTSGQDAYSFQLSADGSVAVVAVADGLGSCKYSHVGAVAATRVICNELADARYRAIFEQELIDASHPLVVASLDAARRAVQTEGEQLGDPGLVSTTLIVVAIHLVVQPRIALFMRIGDPNAFAVLDSKIRRTPVFGEKGEEGPTNRVSASLPRSNPADTAEVRRVSLPPGAAVVLTSDGVGDDISASAQLRSWLDERWKQPLDAVAMLDSLRYRRQSSFDDRTAVVIYQPNVPVDLVEFLPGDVEPEPFVIDDAWPEPTDPFVVQQKLKPPQSPVAGNQRPSGTPYPVAAALATGYGHQPLNPYVGVEPAAVRKPQPIPPVTQPRSPVGKWILYAAAGALILSGLAIFLGSRSGGGGSNATTVPKVTAVLKSSETVTSEPPASDSQETDPPLPTSIATPIQPTTTSALQRTTTIGGSPKTTAKPFAYIDGDRNGGSVNLRSDEVAVVFKDGRRPTPISPCTVLPSEPECDAILTAATPDTVAIDKAAIWFASPSAVLLRRAADAPGEPHAVKYKFGADNVRWLVAIDRSHALVLGGLRLTLVVLDEKTRQLNVSEAGTNQCQGDLRLTAYDPAKGPYAICWMSESAAQIVSLTADGAQFVGNTLNKAQREAARDATVAAIQGGDFVVQPGNSPNGQPVSLGPIA
jgi:serine/threonine protein phosphatase PrpC